MTLNIRSWITGVNTLKTSRLWIGLLIIVTLFSSFALVIMGREWLDIQPMNHSVQVPSKLLGSYSGVTIKTREGWKLACSMAPSRNGGTVILLHGYAADRLQLLPEASLLQQEGFGILFCDSRAQGESEGRLITYGQEEALDLHEIMTWLSRQEAVDSQKIAGFGFSMGAMTLALAAVDDPRIASIVLAAAPSSLYDIALNEGGIFPMFQAQLKLLTLELFGIQTHRISVAAALKKMSPRPVFMIHGAQDSIVPEAQMETNNLSAAQPKSRLVLPQAAHGNFYQANAEIYAKQLIEFYSKSLEIR